jgi:hypothetical protein
MDQFAPFQVSARVRVTSPNENPTATQSVVLTHETPVRTFTPLFGFGLGTADQTEPFHDAVNVSSAPPTAMQKVVLVHETLPNSPAVSVAAAPGIDLAKAGATNATAITRTVPFTRRRRPTMATPTRWR